MPHTDFTTYLAEKSIPNIHGRRSTWAHITAGRFPLAPSMIERIRKGKKIRVEAWHVLEQQNYKLLKNIQGSKKSVSTTIKIPSLNMFQEGIEQGGGMSVRLEGTVLIESRDDIWSKPDEHGRRWIDVKYLASQHSRVGRMHKAKNSASNAIMMNPSTFNANLNDRFSRLVDKIQNKIRADIIMKTDLLDFSLRVRHHSMPEATKDDFLRYRKSLASMLMSYSIIRDPEFGGILNNMSADTAFTVLMDRYAGKQKPKIIKMYFDGVDKWTNKHAKIMEAILFPESMMSNEEAVHEIRKQMSTSPFEWVINEISIQKVYVNMIQTGARIKREAHQNRVNMGQEINTPKDFEELSKVIDDMRAERAAVTLKNIGINSRTDVVLVWSMEEYVRHMAKEQSRIK